MEKEKKYPILIIDDDSEIHSVLSSLLTFWEFTPCSAYNAYEGLSQALRVNPLLIFLDMDLPEINGEKILKLIKAIDQIKDIPILVLSGSLDKELMQRTNKFGASGFLSKPFSHEMLFNKLLEFIPKHIIEELNIQSLSK